MFRKKKSSTEVVLNQTELVSILLLAFHAVHSGAVDLPNDTYRQAFNKLIGIVNITRNSKGNFLYQIVDEFTITNREW